MDMHEVTTKLIGNVNPVGSSVEDAERFENLKVMTNLVEKLVEDIGQVATKRSSNEFSVSRAGTFAAKFLDDLGVVE